MKKTFYLIAIFSICAIIVPATDDVYESWLTQSVCKLKKITNRQGDSTRFENPDPATSGTTMTFSPNGNFLNTMGMQNKSVTGMWSFNGDNSKVILSTDSHQLVLKLQALTATELSFLSAQVVKVNPFVYDTLMLYYVH